MHPGETDTGKNSTNCIRVVDNASLPPYIILRKEWMGKFSRMGDILMKKIIVGACIALCAHYAMAVTPVTIPWSNSFEGLSGDITNYDAWMGDGTGIITNYDYSLQRQNSPKVKDPIEGTHTNVLYFTDCVTGLSNSLSDGAAGSTHTVWLDTMIQPVFSDTEPSVASYTNSQLAIYFDTNGMPYVYHAFKSGYAVTPANSNGWSLLNNTVTPVQSGKWVRLTIAVSYDTDEGEALFRPLLNGVEFSSPNGFSTNNLSATTTGPWFAVASPGIYQVKQVVLQGSGRVDDMVITDSPVSVDLAGVTIVSVIKAGKGTISPEGTIDFSSVPASTNYQITASNYWYISNVYTGATGGTSSGAVVAAQGTNDFALAMSDVGADSFVYVYFEPTLVGTYQTPSEWLSRYSGVPTGTDTNDSDSDGMSDGQEYVAGTIPNDSNSLVRIMSETIANGTNTIQWLGANATDGSGRVYTMRSSTNLLDSTWPSAASLTLTSGTTNTTAISMPADSPVFYRINVTNTAAWQ